MTGAEREAAARALEEAAAEFEQIAARGMPDRRAKSNRQRARFTARGHRAGAMMRAAKTLRDRAANIRASEDQGFVPPCGHGPYCACWSFALTGPTFARWSES